VSTPTTSSPRWRAPHRIETARLDLCAIGPEHVDQAQEVVLRNRDHLLVAMPWARAEPLSVEARMELFQQMRGNFHLGVEFTYAIVDRAAGEFIGGTGFHPRIGPDALEIGYWIDRTLQGKGLVSEAVTALCSVAFEIMKARRLEIRCSPENVRSRAVAQRLGFQLDGVLRDSGYGGSGELEDKMVWSVIAREYPAHALFTAARPTAFDARGQRLAWPDPDNGSPGTERT
jgi:RimJ/RimL family protein N-acetyltransferase